MGINASRLFSVLYNQNLKVGRVQTPTLAMIVDRNQKIKEFTKEKYYMAHIKFDDMDAVTEHFQKKEDADRVAADCMERMCEVEKDDVKEKTVRPPKLYDLTTLQREANRMFGYTAQQTLDSLQARGKRWIRRQQRSSCLKEKSIIRIWYPEKQGDSMKQPWKWLIPEREMYSLI